MARWLVSVDGERFDTEEIPYWFPDGDIFGIEVDGKVYLTGPAFEKLGTAQEVHDTASKSLDEYGAAISVLSPNFRRVEAGSLIRETDDGKRHITVFPATGTIRARAKAHGQLTIVGQPEPKETQAQRLLQTAKRRPHLLTAITLWGDGDRSWPRLYRIMEEIESDFGMPLNEVGLCSRNERQRFTQSANSAEAAGKDSRHGRSRFKPPLKPMTPRDAANFIHLMLQRVASR